VDPKFSISTIISVLVIGKLVNGSAEAPISSQAYDFALDSSLLQLLETGQESVQATFPVMNYGSSAASDIRTAAYILEQNGNKTPLAVGVVSVGPFGTTQAVLLLHSRQLASVVQFTVNDDLRYEEVTTHNNYFNLVVYFEANNNSSSGGVSPLVPIGIVVGILVVIILVAAVVGVALWIRHQNRSVAKGKQEQSYVDLGAYDSEKGRSDPNIQTN